MLFSHFSLRKTGGAAVECLSLYATLVSSISFVYIRLSRGQGILNDHAGANHAAVSISDIGFESVHY